MSAGPELQVDTGCIRQSAATLDGTAQRFGAAAPGTGPIVQPGALGADAEPVARLVGSRCAQAQQAADQLAAVATGLSQHLTLCADTFDRTETGLRWPR
jgi:hypothetical protein